jgi:hypothetical protein
MSTAAFIQISFLGSGDSEKPHFLDQLQESWFNQGWFTHQSLERDPDPQTPVFGVWIPESISRKMAKWEPKKMDLSLFWQQHIFVIKGDTTKDTALCGMPL